MHRHGIHLAHLGQDVGDEVFVHHRLALHGVNLAICPGLVDEVDGLVGEKAVAQMLGTGADGIFDGLVGITDMVELLVFEP